MTQKSDLPETVHVFGNLLTFRMGPADTGDSFSVIECRTAPGAGAPPNRHVEDEAFYIQEGKLEFAIEADVRTYGPGDIVRIPNNAVHAFRNVGNAPSRMIILNWPGHDHNGFFREVGDAVEPGSTEFPTDAPPPDPKAIIAIGAKHNMIFLPPPE